MKTKRSSTLVALASLVAVVATHVAVAATINVLADGVGGCKLRDAIRAANTNTAYMNCTAGAGTDTLVLQQNDGKPVFSAGQAATADEDDNFTGDLDITSAIIIQGTNPEQTIIVGHDFDRTFDVRPGGSLTLNDVTVIGGSVVGGTANDGGVVRKNAGATLTINRSVLRDGTADLGGAVYATGTGVLTLDKVSIFDNSANFGGGIALTQPSGIEAVLNNLTISGNIANVTAGGLYAQGWFRLRNSTVTNNKSVGVGGVQYGLSGNTTGVNFANSVLVGNANGNGDPSDLYCSGSTGNNQLGSRAFTMIGAVVNCTFASTSGNPASSDARLSPLFDFGSGRPTHALLAGSAALNAGNPSNSNALLACLSSDARGVSRSTSCDIGAYEQKIDVTVNSFNDFPDLNPGDGVCQAQGNTCTLRALTMEASASGGRWFVNLPSGTYFLNRNLNPNNDPDGGDIDVRREEHDNPLQLTLMGAGDADATRIVSTVADRVLEVRGREGTGPGFDFVHYPLAFALFNATLSGGALVVDPFEVDPNGHLDGGGIKITGGSTLFYNVVIKDNVVAAEPPGDNAYAGGVFVDTRSRNFSNSNLPYAAESRFERFAVIDNTVVYPGGYNVFAGGVFATGPSTFDEASDGFSMVNGTIADNQSQLYGGGAMLYGIFSASFVSIVGNSSGPLNPPGFTQYAGGLTAGGQDNFVRNLLIAGNLAGIEPSDCETSEFNSSLVSLGHNLIESPGDSCAISGDTSTNLLNVDPELGPRQVSAGMPFHSPDPTSPAVDAIPVPACDDVGGFAVQLDATGAARRSEANPACDIGAAEAVELPIFVDGFDP